MICQSEALVTILRLLVLMSVTAGGVPKKHFDALRREILHTYGHENVITLSALQHAGARRPADAHSSAHEVSIIRRDEDGGTMATAIALQYCICGKATARHYSICAQHASRARLPSVSSACC